MLAFRAGLIALGIAGAASSACAGTLQRVQTSGQLSCAAVEHPGLAQVERGGRITGLAVDLCRAVAIAVLGPEGRVAFRLLDSEAEFDAARSGHDDILFLSGGEIADHRLAGSLVPGPAILVGRYTLMVPVNLPAHAIAELAGATVCFMIASPAQRALEAGLHERGMDVARIGFQEDEEMLDAYNAQRCQAVAGEAGELAVMRGEPGAKGFASRILDDSLALAPVFAATNTADGAWAATVGWVLDAVVATGARPTPWRGLFPLEAGELGLRPGWREEISCALGSYDEMVSRHLGDGSALKLAPGPNAPWPAGLLLPVTQD